MSNVLIVGASGSLARVATDRFLNETDAKLTLFVRDARKLKHLERTRARC